MAVDPNNPALPIGTTQVEVAAELRGIKGVVKTNKDNIALINTLLSNVSLVTAWAGDLLEKTSSPLALDYLGATVTGKEIFAIESYEALATALGVEDFSPVINTAGSKTCIRFGELKFNLIFGSFNDMTDHVWHTAFTRVLFGVLTARNEDNNGTVQAFNNTLTGCRVSFDGGGTKPYTVLAIGI